MKNATIEKYCLLLMIVLMGIGVVVHEFKKNIPDLVFVLLSILVLILLVVWSKSLCAPDDESNEPEKDETKTKI